MKVTAILVVSLLFLTLVQVDAYIPIQAFGHMMIYHKMYSGLRKAAKIGT